MSVPDSDVHADTKTLQDADYDTDGDGYVYVGAGFYADVGSNPRELFTVSDILVDEYANDFTVVYARDRTIASHKHRDQYECKCHIIVDDDRTYVVCPDCGAYLRINTRRSAAS